VDPTGKFAYVANQGCADAFTGRVSMFTIDPSTGALTSTGTPADTGDFGADSVTVDPSGKFVYGANWGSGDGPGSVSSYTINPTTGVLTSIGTIPAPCAPPPSPGACSPWSVAVDPSGKFAYVANEGGFAPTSISTYRIDSANGALTYTGLVAAGGRAVSVTVHPTGKFAYAATDGVPRSVGGVSVFTIDATTGALPSTGTIAAGTDPSFVAVDPTGKFAYVSNGGSDNVSMYTIDGTTGTLTSLGTITGGGGPIAIHPSGQFAYVGNPVRNRHGHRALNVPRNNGRGR
jgi:6-phosphogluconolactonase